MLERKENGLLKLEEINALKEAVAKLNGMEAIHLATTLRMAENLSTISGESICKMLPLIMEKLRIGEK